MSTFYLSSSQKFCREIRVVTFWKLDGLCAYTAVCIGGFDCSCGPDHSDQARALFPEGFDIDAFW